MAAPTPAQLQGNSNGFDLELLALARSRRPQRRWWWGRRTIEHRTGAWCYLCQRFCATWSGRWRVPVIAQQAIQAHRTEHLQGRLDTPRNEVAR